jgi:hypothetical protein
MKNTKAKLFILLVFIALNATSALAATADEFLITRKSVGRVELGMTVGQARRIWKDYKFERTSDGEFTALIAVTSGNEKLLTIYADEKGYLNEKSPIQDGARIEHIEIWDERFRTAEGVYAGMKLRAAEKIYGPVREIFVSPIESREYAEFTKQPLFLDFRVAGTGKNLAAGADYRQNESGLKISEKYTPDAYIFNITIAENVYTDDETFRDGIEFTSFYTDLETDCRVQESVEGSHVSTFCQGPGNFRIHYFDSATTLSFRAETTDRRESVHLTEQSLSYPEENTVIEWRLADGKPFAVLMQTSEYKRNETDGLIKYPTETLGSERIVRGLNGFEQIEFAVGGNEFQTARQTADNAYIEGVKPARRIEIPATSGHAVFDEIITATGGRIKYKLRAEKGQHLTVRIGDVVTNDEEGAIMIGSVISPEGVSDGNAGGLIFDSTLDETGDYIIVVRQNRAKSQAINIRFKVTITLKKTDE